MTKHHTPTHFERPQQTPCPIAELALRFGAAEKEWHALDGHGDEDALAFNEITMGALVDIASLGQPTSPLGALFQVLIISQQADLIYSHVDEGVRPQVRVDVMRLEGALWGIRRFLEAHFGITAEAIGAEYMMTESVSYAAKLRKAVAAAAAAAEADATDTSPRQLQAAE